MAHLVYVGVGDARDEHFGVTFAEADALVHAALVRAFGDIGERVYQAAPPAAPSAPRMRLMQPGDVRVAVASGVMGSGKDTFMTALRAVLEGRGERTQTLALARALKDLARYYFLLSDLQLDGSLADKNAVDERYGLSSRQILQRLGTEGMRAVAGEDIWRRAWQARLESTTTVVLVPDGRFPDELDHLRERWGARTFYIERLVATEAMMTACNGQPHISEVLMANYPHYTERIDNNGPVDRLEAFAAGAAELL